MCTLGTTFRVSLSAAIKLPHIEQRLGREEATNLTFLMRANVSTLLCCKLVLPKRTPSWFYWSSEHWMQEEISETAEGNMYLFSVALSTTRRFWFFFFVVSTQHHYTCITPACFLEVSNACVKLALMKSQSLFRENTVHIVSFNNSLKNRPVAVLQTKLMDINSLLDSGSQNSIDSSQWCIDTGYGRALEKLKTSLISSQWLHIMKFCLDTGGGNLQSQDTWHDLY